MSPDTALRRAHPTKASLQHRLQLRFCSKFFRRGTMSTEGVVGNFPPLAGTSTVTRQIEEAQACTLMRLVRSRHD